MGKKTPQVEAYQNCIKSLSDKQAAPTPSEFAKKWVEDNPKDDYQRVRQSLKTTYRKLLSKEQRVNKLIEEHVKDTNGNIAQVDSFWHKTKEFSVRYKMPQIVDDFDYELVINNIVKRYKEKERPLPQVIETNERCLNLVKSDVHIGMRTDDGIFSFKWDKEEFMDRVDKLLLDVFKKVDREGAYQKLVIYDLGDSLDGYNKLTTRGGHELSQNMDNIESFEAHVEGNVYLIEQLVKRGVAKEYVFDTIGNDNHSGDYGIIAQIAVRKIVEVMIPNQVKFNIRRKFISHSIFGEHCEIITHGKDAKYMRSGLPYQLSPQHINYINQYIALSGIKSKFIRLYKGDLHQLGFQQTQGFDYYNFMSFAPPNAYGQVNYMTAKSGYSLISYDANSSDIEVVNRTFKNEVYVNSNDTI